jgi:hypothetical protein
MFRKPRVWFTAPRQTILTEISHDLYRFLKKNSGWIRTWNRSRFYPWTLFSSGLYSSHHSMLYNLRSCHIVVTETNKQPRLIVKKNDRRMKLITHLRLVPRLRMRGVVHTLPHSPSWRGAYWSRGYIYMSWCLVKQRYNFTFTGLRMILTSVLR